MKMLKFSNLNVIVKVEISAISALNKLKVQKCKVYRDKNLFLREVYFY